MHLSNLYDYQVYIFDCDGVILDSNEIKSNAFGDVVKRFGEAKANQFVEYHKNNGGVSRHEKFKFFIEKILKIDFDKELYDSLLGLYKEQTLNQLISCDFTSGFLDFIRKLNPQYNFVASGGQQTDLDIVFKEKNIAQYFNSILGSPKTKIENVHFLLNSGKVTTKMLSKGVFFGDSKSDFDAAKEFNMDFVFISDYSEIKTKDHFIKENKIESISNFLELLR